MYTIEDRRNLKAYLEAVFMPLARPMAAADVIVNVASFGTDDWDEDHGVQEGLQRVVMGPTCHNVAEDGEGFTCSVCDLELDQDACESIGDIRYCPHCGSEVI